MRTTLLLSFIAVLFTGAVKSNAQAIPQVDFCDLFDSYEKYEGRLISSTAMMTYSTVTRVDGDESEMYSLKCNDPDHVAHISYATKQSWQFLKDLKPETHFIFAIKFTGRITVEEIPTFGHLSWARADVQLAKVDLTLSLPTEGKTNWPKWDAPAPLNERASQLQSIPRQFLPSLYITPERMQDNISSLMSDDFIFTKKNGKRLSKDEYIRAEFPIISLSRLGTIGIGMEHVKRTKQGVSARGFVKTDFGSQNQKTFNCRLTFVLKDGSWIISSARLE